MIEAMACGTPVIAWRNGSVPEIMAHGRSGYVVDSVADAVSAVGQLDKISRAGVRAHFDNHFTDTRMASQYVGVYARLLAMPKVTTAARVVPLVGSVAPATIRRELRVASLMTGKAPSRRGTSIDALAVEINLPRKSRPISQIQIPSHRSVTIAADDCS
jgi:hypothetical protein